MRIPEGMKKKHMDIPLDPIDKPESEIVLTNVFFDRFKSNLRPESYIELDNLINFLKKNTDIKIELGGHTDSRGIESENITLSKNRAEAVYNYLISQGIDSKRMEYRGYGSSQPVIDDQTISLLTDEKEIKKAHQTNRRTIYKIIK